MPSRPKCIFWLTIPCLFLLSSAYTFADRNMQIDAVVGIGIPSHSNFDEAAIYGVAFTYVTSSLNFRAGLINLGDFELANSDSDNHLEIVGTYLELVKVIHLDLLDLELGAGIAATEAKMYFEGERLHQESDTSPFVEFVVAKNVSELLTLQAGIAWFSDVSGSDITAPKAGIRFSF